MTTHHATLDGLPIRKAVISIPARGAWFVSSIELVDAPTKAPAGALRVGAAEWRGTVRGAAVFGDQWRGEMIAGAGGWSRSIGRQGYHNDAGVKAALVIGDAARAAGETLGIVAPSAAQLGINFARKAGPASDTLIEASGSATWWVDRAGVTHVGQRTPRTLDAVDVVKYDPEQGRLEFVCDDLAKVDAGVTITDSRLPAPFVVGALDIHLSPDSIRCVAWAAVERSPLLDAVRALVRQVIAEQGLFGAYEYRVVTMSAKRVDLQAVDRDAGLPDLKAIDQWPGLAGAHADLKRSASVLVSFIGGDRARPVVTSYVGGNLGVPPMLTLGGEGALPAVRNTDPVVCPLPPAVFSGTIGGAPATGVLTFPTMQVQGVNTGGSAKVKIA